MLALMQLPAARGAIVCDRELLLINRLDEARTNALVAITLDEIAIPIEDEKKIRGVEIRDAQGQAIPAQFDSFGAPEEFRGEVAFLADFKPRASRLVRIQFQDTPPAGLDKAGGLECRADGDQAVNVATPEFKARIVRDRGSLEFRRVVLTRTTDVTDDLVASLENAPSMPGADLGKAAEAESQEFGGGGLPFAFQGLRTFGDKPPRMVTSRGTVRVTVTLFDQGPWRTASVVIPCRARQTLSVPIRGRTVYLACVVVPEAEVPKGRLDLGGLRIDSVNQAWDLKMGQNGKPPHVAPVKITLHNTLHKGKGPILLESYQLGTFNHITARVASKAAWAGVAADRGAAGLGKGIHIHFEDKGPPYNSVQPLANVARLPAGQVAVARAVFKFGGPETPGDMDAVGRQVNSPLYVPYLNTVTSAPPDATRIKTLVRECDVVVVVPDEADPEREALWARLAKGLGGTVQRQKPFTAYLDWHAGYSNMVKRFPPLLMVIVGEPGEHGLLDRFNATRRLFSRYPISAPRMELYLFENPDPPGHLLLVFGNTREATAAAVDKLLNAAGALPEPPTMSITVQQWADRMPFPWLGVKERAGDAVSMATAFRNGHGEHLLFLKANRDVAALRIEAPEGIRMRYVPWYYGKAEDDTLMVGPAHDAAFSEPPAGLKAGEQLGLWLSVSVPRDAAPGKRQDTVKVLCDGVARNVRLETDILAPILPDKSPIGFYPMGASKDFLKPYLGWPDDATYNSHLTAILKQLAEFGVNYYALDITGFKGAVDPAGDVTVDSTEFRKELEAVRAAGTIDVMEVGSLNHICAGADGQVMARKKLASESEARERVIAPALRQALRELNLEDVFYCRHGDEISDYEPWLVDARIIKRAGFKTTVAINGYGVFNKHLAVGTMDLWMPLFNFYLNRWGNPVPPDDPEMFNQNFRDARLKAGEQIWPYVCGPGPYAFGPRGRSRGRFLLLDGYMKRAHGMTYYGGLVWSHALDPAFRNKQLANLFTEDCTFVSLFYPVPKNNSVIPSLRVGAIRMGQEDAGAIESLRRLARERGRAEEIEKRLAAEYEKIEMDSPEDVFSAFRRQLDLMTRDLKPR